MTDVKDFEGTYVLDSVHSGVGFVARHAMVTKVRGEFTDFNATFTVSADKGYDVAAVIQTNSLNSGSEDRDKHLLGPDFFDVDNYPEITFKTTSSDIGEALKGKVTGDLTIKGVTKPVVLDVEILGIETDPFGNERLGFEASTEINRTDFNIDWNAPLKTGGLLVSEKINIHIDGSAIKQ